MVVHRNGNLDHNTVGREGAHWVSDKVAGEDWVGSLGKEHKVSLPHGGLM